MNGLPSELVVGVLVFAFVIGLPYVLPAPTLRERAISTALCSVCGMPVMPDEVRCPRCRLAKGVR